MVYSSFRFELAARLENKNLQCFHIHTFSLKSLSQIPPFPFPSEQYQKTVRQPPPILTQPNIAERWLLSVVFQTALGKPRGRKIFCYFGETAVHKARVAPSGERPNLGLTCIFPITLEVTLDIRVKIKWLSSSLLLGSPDLLEILLNPRTCTN